MQLRWCYCVKHGQYPYNNSLHFLFVCLFFIFFKGNSLHDLDVLFTCKWKYKNIFICILDVLYILLKRKKICLIIFSKSCHICIISMLMLYRTKHNQMINSPKDRQWGMPTKRKKLHLKWGHRKKKMTSGFNFRIFWLSLTSRL